MKEHYNFQSAGLVLVTLCLLGFPTVSFSQSSKTQLSAIQRQAISERHKKIAELHTKMAECIMSDKSPFVCRQEMINSCSTNFGDGCTIMGRPGGRGKGMMNGACMDWMIAPETETSAPAATQPKK